MAKGVTARSASSCLREASPLARPRSPQIVVCLVRPMSTAHFDRGAYFGNTCGPRPSALPFTSTVPAPHIGVDNMAWQSEADATWVAFHNGEAVVDVWLMDYSSRSSPAADLLMATRIARDAATHL